MLIIGLILFGMLVGAAAELILGARRGINWPVAFGCGLGGSFVGGLLSSLVSGDGIELRPAGLIGSLIGAIIVTLGWMWWKGRAAS